MPALVLCGRAFLLAPDDLWTFIWIFVPLHLLWAAADSSRTFKSVLHTAHVPEIFLPFDVAFCLVCIPLDLGIWIFSARGVIMRPRVHESLFYCFLWVRIFTAVLHMVGWFCISVPALVSVLRVFCGQAFPEARDMNQQLHDAWALSLVIFILLGRSAVYVALVSLEFALLLPKAGQGVVLSNGAYIALRLIGAGDDLYSTMLKTVTKDIFGEEMTLDKVTLTDMLYGMLLLATAQKQGLLGYSPDDVDENLHSEHTRLLEEGYTPKVDIKVPPSVLRATALTGLHRATTPLSRLNSLDHAALLEIAHMAPFASGIYGPVLFGLLAKAMEPGTFVPSRCGSAICKMMPCWRRMRPGSSSAERLRRSCCCCAPCIACCTASGPTRGDWSCGIFEDHLWNEVSDAALQGSIHEPDLIWASWRNHGNDCGICCNCCFRPGVVPGKSLPMSIIVDHAYKNVVITVRGTADWKDIINDLAFKPVFFDPLNIGGSEANKTAPFNSEQDLFVADLWLTIADECLRELREEALHIVDTRFPEYGYVVTGHSLGAGVGCLLALQMRRHFPDKHIHFVGFEPPGCVLSKRLARETQKLGWISTVCAHDFVPRISIKSVQRILNGAISELEACDRSKLQITCLLVSGFLRQARCLGCFRRPIANLWEFLGGGPLTGIVDSGHKLAQVDLPRANRSYPDMCPPGDLVYLRPLACELRCCSLFQKDIEWCAEWADPQDVQQEFILSIPRAIELHTPWVYQDAISCVVDSFVQVAGAPKVCAFSQPRSGGRRP